MKNFKMNKALMVVAALTGILALSNVAIAVEPTNPATASQPTSDGGITPYIIPGGSSGGNRTCSEVGFTFFGNATYYSCSSARVNFNDGSFEGGFEDISGNEGCSSNIIGATTDGTYVSWTSSTGMGAAIVKGSNDANIYVYEPQSTSDSGLASPLNASGQPAGLSNLTFCWNPGPPPACFEDETAWAAGTRYVTRGNWATYTPYAGAEKTVTLFAGQTMEAGTVHFSAPDGNEVTITITLNTGWRFALIPSSENEFDNNVKIQDYASPPPAENPAPGLFMWKRVATESPFSITVPLNNFYGVHVDVEHQVPCPAQ